MLGFWQGERAGRYKDAFFVKGCIMWTVHGIPKFFEINNSWTTNAPQIGKKCVGDQGTD